jgi:hypothetical protein
MDEMKPTNIRDRRQWTVLIEGLLIVATTTLVGQSAHAADHTWKGTGTSNDRLLFATSPGLTNAQLANFAFFNDSHTPFAVGGTIIAYGNEFELVPVPEPSTWIGGALAVGVLGWSVLKKRKTETRKS